MKMKKLRRNWNWIPSSEEIFINDELLNNKNIYTTTLYDNTFFKIKTVIVTDDHGIYLSLKNIFSSKEPNNSDKAKYKESKIYYFTEETSFRKKNPNLEISTSRAKTDVYFDPICFTLLMIGPKKIGFIKSLLKGIKSYWGISQGIYGLHCSVVSSDKKSIIFCGKHATGKTTSSLSKVILDNQYKVVSDDWAYFRKINDNIIITGDNNVFLDISTFKYLENVIPNDYLISSVFFKYFNESLNESLLFEEDKRHHIDYSRLSMSKYFKPSCSNPQKICFLFDEAITYDSSQIENNQIRFIMESSYHIPFHNSSFLAKFSNTQSKHVQEYYEVVNTYLKKEIAFWESFLSTIEIVCLEYKEFTKAGFINKLLSL